MPHCVLEYSANVLDRPDFRNLFLELHDQLVGTGLFRRQDIKSRAIRHETFLVGDGDPSRAFVALDVRILSGRLDEEKGAIGDSALELLVRWFPRTFREGKASFTVQITDLHRESYRRRSSRDE